MGKLTDVSVNGRLTTWVSLLPHLLTIWQRERLYRSGVWRCRCREGACDEVPASDDGPAELPGGAWSICPYGVLRSPQFSALLTLHECAKIAPLAGWPDDFPAWLTWGLVTFRKRLEGGKS